jgi:hypothetical protein
MTRTMAEMRVLSQAHAVALQAKCGLVRRDALEALTGAAMTVLPEDDPVRLRVAAFIASVRLHGRQPVALAQAGDDLQMSVRRALWPTGEDGARRDIHG